MDRHRGGDRYGNNQDSHHYRHSRGAPPSSRAYADAPMNHHHHRRSPSSYRGSRDHRAFDSPPRYPSGVGAGDGGGGYNASHQNLPPLSGQKRAYPFSGRGGESPDKSDSASFAKLFVGSVPRTATEEDIRPLFEEHGRVLEVALIKDKRTGQQQGCCFIKYSTSEEADRAIRALHNNYTLPGGMGPIQVRYADGERERLGAVEYKLFVGSMNKYATEKDIEEIFSPYGRVEDVYLMRDDMKQSRGCGFVKYSQREMALAAINALNGKFTMRGCDQPLTVRFADPKRPRPGDQRGVPAFGGPGFGPRFPAPGIRPAPNMGEPMRGPGTPNAWYPMSPQNQGPPPTIGMQGFGGQFPPRSGDMPPSSTIGGPLGGPGSTADSSLPGLVASSTPMLQQNPNMPYPHIPSGSQQISPLPKPLQSPPQLPSLHLQPTASAGFPPAQTSQASFRQPSQVQLAQSVGQIPFSQSLPSQQLYGLGGQLSVSQPQVAQITSSASGQALSSSSLQSHVLPAMGNMQQLPVQHQLPQQPVHQSSSQLAHMLSQQTQSLQASFQSSQQAFSQLQHQMQLMQPSAQSLAAQQGTQAAKQQSQWSGTALQPVASAPAGQSGADIHSSTPTASGAATVTQAFVPVRCNWSEHTSPDGYKYYYNSTTGESKWEKPEELTVYEQQQQQQKPSVQQPQMQSLPHGAQVVPHVQLQSQHQTQMRPQQQLQQSSQLTAFQVPAITGHQSVQGPQAAQEWMWKNKPTGT